MAKRTLLETILRSAKEVLLEDLEARQKAREESQKTAASESGETSEPGASGPSTREPAATEPGTARAPEPPPQARSSVKPNHEASSPAAPEVAPSERTVTGAAPPVFGARMWRTELGASVLDPPPSDTWDFCGAVDDGASIDGGDGPGDGIQVAVQADARRDETSSSAEEIVREPRRPRRAGARRRRSAASKNARVQPRPRGEDRRAEARDRGRAAEPLQAEVAGASEQPPSRGVQPPLVRSDRLPPEIEALLSQLLEGEMREPESDVAVRPAAPTPTPTPTPTPRSQSKTVRRSPDISRTLPHYLWHLVSAAGHWNESDGSDAT